MAVFYRVFGRFRTGFCLLLVLFLGVLVPQSLADDAVYTVQGVEVDVTADNAVQAREMGFEQAQITAFRILAERLLTLDELMLFAMPEVEGISALVQDFEVTNEQLSSVRYKGVYTFRFRPEAVRTLFSGGGHSYTDVVRKPVLVLPFYQENGRTVLWQQPNPWMIAWYQRKFHNALVPVAVPLGDLQDVAQLRGDAPLQYDPIKLQALIQRYRADEAVILIASPVAGRLRVDFYRTDGTGPDFVKTLMVTQPIGALDETLYTRGVQDVMAFLQRDWKTRAATAAPQTTDQHYQASVKFSSLQEWIETKKALEKVPGITEVKVGGLKPKAAEVSLAFKGDENDLKIALHQAGMTLIVPQPHYDPYWSWTESSAQQEPYELYLNKYRQF